MSTGTIGILGGMSPESTIVYYQHIVHTWQRRHGDHAYPEVVIHSVSFEPYIRAPAEGRWGEVADGLAAAARRLEAGQVDVIVVATNTMHRVLPQIQAAVSVPVLDVREVIAREARRRGLTRVALLGTRHTMADPTYVAALEQRGLDVVIPSDEHQECIDKTIYGELIRGQVTAAAKMRFARVLGAQITRGAEGAILGCTELPLLAKEEDVGLPLLDSARLHAEAALDFLAST